MSFSTELASTDFQINIVISIDSIFYSQFQVDADSTDIIGTGSLIDSDKVGVVDKANTTPTSVDFRTVKTSLNTVNFSLIDLDLIISNTIGASSTQLLEEDVVVFVGFITGSFDMSDYIEIARPIVKKISHKENVYKFTCVAVTDLLSKDIFTLFGVLNGAINDSVTTLTLDDASSFPSSGIIRIDNEFIAYTGKSVNNLTGLSRADLSSTADSHDDDSQVFNVVDTGTVNPIDLMLDIMKSPDNGTLADGLNIDPARIDSTAFTDIRDSFFSGELFQFFLVEIGNGLAFLEDELLLATNTRFVEDNGKISLAILDQIDLSTTPPVIDEDTIITTPTWNLNSDKIINQVEIKWNFSEGLNKFSRTSPFSDSDSISTFGSKSPLKMEFKGVRAASGGSAIVTNRASRILARLATPKAQIKVNTFFKNIELIPGSNVTLEHRYVPQEGASLGIIQQLEIQSRAIDLTSARVSFDLAYTSFSGLRIGVIAPSPLIVSVVSQKIFTVPDGACYRSGDFLRLWDDLSLDYFSDVDNEILSVIGNTITMVNNFTTTLTTSIRVKISDYDQASVFQQTKYAFVGLNVGNFADGTKSYEILP